MPHLSFQVLLHFEYSTTLSVTLNVTKYRITNVEKFLLLHSIRPDAECGVKREAAHVGVGAFDRLNTEISF